MKLRRMCDVEIGPGRYASVVMSLPEGTRFVSTQSTGLQADGSGALAWRHDPECRHCGNPDPGERCRYCGTSRRT